MLCSFEICKKCSCKHLAIIPMRAADRISELSDKGFMLDSVCYQTFGNCKYNVSVHIQTNLNSDRAIRTVDKNEFVFCAIDFNEMRMSVPDDCPYKFEHDMLNQLFDKEDEDV